MKSFLENFNIIKQKKLIKKYFKPRRAFLEESKVLFLEKLKEKGVIKIQTNRNNSYINSIPKYAFIGVSAVLIFGGCLAVFAEKQNVPATSPIYELKRISEVVQLTITPKSKKPEAHEKLAQRRLQEIKQVQIVNEKIIKEQINKNSKEYEKTKSKIQNLNKDFHIEVEATIQDIQIPQNENMATSPQPQNEVFKPALETNNKREKELCENIAEKIKEHRQILPEAKEQEDKEWIKFYEKCSAYMSIDSQKKYESEQQGRENKQEEIKSKQQKIETRRESEKNYSNDREENKKREKDDGDERSGKDNDD